MLDGKSNDVSEKQPENALMPISVTSPLNSTDLSAMQSENVLPAIFVTPLPISAAASDKHPENAASSVVTVSGIFISVSAEHFLNAPFSISTMFAPRTTDLSAEQPANELEPITRLLIETEIKPVQSLKAL